MKRITRIGLILLGGAIALTASQEQSRTYVSNCFCSLCSYLFGS